MAEKDIFQDDQEFQNLPDDLKEKIKNIGVLADPHKKIESGRKQQVGNDFGRIASTIDLYTRYKDRKENELKLKPGELMRNLLVFKDKAFQRLVSVYSEPGDDAMIRESIQIFNNKLEGQQDLYDLLPAYEKALAKKKNE